MRPRRMNPRQRQGMMLVVIAAAGLLGVFLLIADYVSSVSKQVGGKISIVTLAAPLPAYQPVTPNMLSEVSVPQKWAPHNALTDPATALGLVSRSDLPAGTELESGMLIQNPGLVAGKRAFTIIVNAQSGVALQVEPGDLVDVVATYPAPSSTNAGTRPGSRNRAEVVVPSAEVLTVGQAAAGTENGASVPVNLLLTPDQVLRVLFAESFAAKLSLSKVAPGSTPTTPPIYAPTQ